ncbi:MAG: polymer-forming cytoskeletal protein [Flavobacteriaceae bacterium]|nr:polymer-forming cytoskeletal protein [Flavobacteriaceae bacterium]
MPSKFYTKLDNNTIVNGDFNSKSDLYIDGNMEGSIKTKGEVILEENSKVNGDIECNTLEIKGEFRGKLFAKKTVKIFSKSRVRGNLTYTNMSIEQGASLNAKCSTHQ